MNTVDWEISNLLSGLLLLAGLSLARESSRASNKKHAEYPRASGGTNVLSNNSIFNGKTDESGNIIDFQFFHQVGTVGVNSAVRNE